MDLTTALIRLRQLEAHLAQAHAAAARDERVVGYFQSIRDELADQQIIAELDN